VLRQARGWDTHATWFRRRPVDPHPSPLPEGEGARAALDPHPNPLPGGEGARWHRVDVCDARAVMDVVSRIRPDVILHTAYQFNTPEMERVIVEGTRHVAQATAHVGARLVHLSTDVVFDGRRGGYTEKDRPNPVHDYGRAKLASEELIQATLPAAAIVRTSLVYGFAPLDPRTEWTLAAAQGQNNVTLFTDERRCPIYAPDLADALLELAANDYAGVLHGAGAEAVSRYEFGVLLCRALEVDPTRLRPALAADSPQPRPLDCTLDITRAGQVLRTRLRGVREVIVNQNR
jgi:dTDP-4-dehydrorhamnose reductase